VTTYPLRATTAVFRCRAHRSVSVLPGSLARFERARERRRRRGLGCALHRRSGRVRLAPFFGERREMGNHPSSLEIGRRCRPPRSTADVSHRNTPTPPRFVTRQYFYSSIYSTLSTGSHQYRRLVGAGSSPFLLCRSLRLVEWGPGRAMNTSPRGRCSEKRRAREGEIHPALAVSAMLARASNGGSGNRWEG
jgi:hypothetical protein